MYIIMSLIRVIIYNLPNYTMRENKTKSLRPNCLKKTMPKIPLYQPKYLHCLHYQEKKRKASNLTASRRQCPGFHYISQSILTAYITRKYYIRNSTMSASLFIAFPEWHAWGCLSQNPRPLHTQAFGCSIG